MAKNDFMARQKARDRMMLDVGLQCGRQQILDMMTLVLRDPSIMGKDIFGDAVEISSIDQDTGNVILEGILFKKDYKAKVAYHTPCHMERLGWGVFSTELLKMIPGLELTVLDSNCCGIAGTYGFKKEHYNDSQNIGAPVFRQIKDLQVDMVATDCETCKWQIEMSCGIQVENPISIIADALDVEKTIALNSK